MLTTTRKLPPITSAHSYLHCPDVQDNQWKTRGKGENQVFLCDYDIELTEELKTYLLYFAYTTGKNMGKTLPSFSNIPIKLGSEEKC